MGPYYIVVRRVITPLMEVITPFVASRRHLSVHSSSFFGLALVAALRFFLSEEYIKCAPLQEQWEMKVYRHLLLKM